MSWLRSYLSLALLGGCLAGFVSGQENFDCEEDRPCYLTTFNSFAGDNLLATAPHSLNGTGVLIGFWDGVTPILADSLSRGFLNLGFSEK